MTKLDLTDNTLDDPDALYQRLVDLHDGLSEEESHKANAELILLLAVHIGDQRVIEEAIDTVQAALNSSTAKGGQRR